MCALETRTNFFPFKKSPKPGCVLNSGAYYIREYTVICARSIAYITSTNSYIHMYIGVLVSTRYTCYFILHKYSAKQIYIYIYIYSATLLFDHTVILETTLVFRVFQSVVSTSRTLCDQTIKLQNGCFFASRVWCIHQLQPVSVTLCCDCPGLAHSVYP